MDRQPLISVLMGIYNCADTLEEAVGCIINQTYTNWELILCDDCSTDNTREVAAALVAKDNRIVLLENETNLTLAPTLNKCLSEAHGEYIARMDGDDLCPQDRFEKELRFLEGYPEYALVSCQMNLFDKDGIYRVVTYVDEPQKKDFVFKSQFCHAGCMMRTEVMQQLGGYCVDKNRQRVEDYDLWVRMYEAGYKGYNLQEPLYSMRDDRNAHHRRTLKNRINEMGVQINVCKLFNLPFRYYIWTIVPILKCMVPSFVYKFVHKM